MKQKSATDDSPTGFRRVGTAYYNLLSACDAGIAGVTPHEFSCGSYWPAAVAPIRGKKPGWEFVLVARPVWREVS